MNINFRERAMDATTLSKLMNDREKLSTEDVIALYPEGITIEEFDSVMMKEGQYYVCTFKEEPTKYLNCGSVLSKIFDTYVSAFDGDITGASEGLKASGGLRVKLSKSRTRGGNNITTVTVI